LIVVQLLHIHGAIGYFVLAAAWAELGCELCDFVWRGSQQLISLFPTMLSR